jgi:hypothetical protein
MVEDDGAGDDDVRADRGEEFGVGEPVDHRFAETPPGLPVTGLCAVAASLAVRDMPVVVGFDLLWCGVGGERDVEEVGDVVDAHTVQIQAGHTAAPSAGTFRAGRCRLSARTGRRALGAGGVGRAGA